MPQTPIDLERVQRIAAFRAAMRTFVGASEAVARRAGLTPQRYLLLLMIKGAADGQERLRLTDLADLLKHSRNTVTELVARAEESGLVRREALPGDRRVVLVALTAEGERRLLHAIEELERHRREFAGAFALLAETFDETVRD